MRIKRNLTAAVLAGCMTLSFAAAVPHSSVMADDTASVDEVKQQQEQTREKKRKQRKNLMTLKQQRTTWFRQLQILIHRLTIIRQRSIP